MLPMRVVVLRVGSPVPVRRIIPNILEYRGELELRLLLFPSSEPMVGFAGRSQNLQQHLHHKH